MDLSTLSEKINARAEEFVAESAAAARPFFLYLPFHQTHHPQFAGRKDSRCSDARMRNSK